MHISVSSIAAMAAAAAERYPEEACGLLLDDDSIVVCANRAADRRTTFAVPPEDYLRHDGRIKAVWHSHPDGPNHPSAADMAGQIASGLPWVIIPYYGDPAGDSSGGPGGGGAPPVAWGWAVRPPLLGRPFVHGVTDCYSLIRDWFLAERSVDLPDFPRDDCWWESGGDLYRRHFRAAGFASKPLEDLAAGDVVLMQVRSPVPNHGGVVLEGGLLLHHLAARLSRREPLGPWRRMITHVLTYQGDKA